jgi:catechol 2,3-dioxygenase-like lactoylglutathione lyase family enzyme
LLTGLHHVQVVCPPGSEDALRAFYGGVLRMTEVAKPVPADRGGVRAGRGARSSRAPGAVGPGSPGHRRLYVNDPVGNRQELLEPVNAG